MARSFTLSEIKERARRRADMEDNPFISEPELTQYVNDSIAELHDILVTTYGEDYYTEDYSFYTTSGTDRYALPDAFYKLSGVDVQLNGSSYTTLQKFNFRDRNRYENVGAWTLQGAGGIRYRIVGNELVFASTPTSALAVRVWYTPVATALVDDSDSFDGINGYEEYVVIDAAIKMLQKEESDISILYRQKQDMLKRIESAAANRDSGEPETIGDVSRSHLYDDYGECW